MNRDELRQILKGVPATIPSPFDDDFKLDLARATELTHWWVENGLGTDVAPLKVSAAWGEGPDLGDDEWPHLLRTVVNAAGSDAVIMCALKSKDTLHTIEDARRAQDLGAVGLQIDLPFFHHPNQDDHVRFFTDVSDAIDIGIMIYSTFWFGCESMTAESMHRLEDAEHVVAIKWSTPEDMDYDDMRKFSDVFNVIDNSGQPIRCHKNGGRGHISYLIPAYPKHDLEVWQLLEDGRYDEAQVKLDRVNSVLGPWRARTTERAGGYRQMKGIMKAMGRPAGDPRPPTLPIDDEELAEVKELLRSLDWPVAD